MVNEGTLTKLYAGLIVLAILFVFFSWTRGGRYHLSERLRDGPSSAYTEALVERPKTWEVWLNANSKVSETEDVAGWDEMNPVSAVTVDGRRQYDGPADCASSPALGIVATPPPRIGEIIWQKIVQIVMHYRHSPSASSSELYTAGFSMPAERMSAHQGHPSDGNESQMLQVSVFIQMPSAGSTPDLSIPVIGAAPSPNATAESAIPPLLLGMSTLSFRPRVETTPSIGVEDRGLGHCQMDARSVRSV